MELIMCVVGPSRCLKGKTQSGTRWIALRRVGCRPELLRENSQMALVESVYLVLGLLAIFTCVAWGLWDHFH